MRLELDLTVKHSALGVQFRCLKDGRFCYLTYFSASQLQLLPQVMVWHKLYREEGLRKWLSHHTSHQIPCSPKHHGKAAVMTFSYRQLVRAVQGLKLNDPKEQVTFRHAAC